MTSAGEGRLTYWRHHEVTAAGDLRGVVVMVVVNSEQVEYRTPPKLVFTHVALCGLEETQTDNKIFNRPPEGYIRSRTHTAYHADADYDRR